MRSAFASVKNMRPPAGEKFFVTKPGSGSIHFARYSAAAFSAPPPRADTARANRALRNARRNSGSAARRSAKLGTRCATTYARWNTYEYVMRSLDATRHPRCLSALPTLAVPANASCARPGRIPRRAIAPVMNGRSRVLLPR